MHEEQSISRKRKVAAQIAVGLPELGWSVCEALIIPLLLDLDVPSYLLTITWMCSPVAGLWAQPLVGSFCDRSGTRPCIILLGLFSTFGLICTPICAYQLSGKMRVAATLIAYGITDMGHDLMVTPTRAAMNAIFEPEDSEKRCAIASGVGKLVAQFCATVLPWRFAFAAVACVMFIATLAQLCFSPAPVQQNLTCSVHANVPNGTNSSEFHVPRGFMLIWVLQFAGWFSLCIFSFFFTGVWAELLGASPHTTKFDNAVKTGTALLMVNALPFIFSGYLLPQIVHWCRGETAALLVALAAYAVSFISFGMSCVALIVFGVVIVVPAAAQVLINVPFAWLEHQPEFSEADRGKLTGYLNTSLAAAQAVVAVTCGPIASAFGGHFTPVFYLVCVADVIVLLAAMVNLHCARRRSQARCRPVLSQEFSGALSPNENTT